jgi:GxxExxY protein
MNHNEITGAVIDRALYIHRELGPGLLESVYRKVLCIRVAQAGISGN